MKGQMPRDAPQSQFIDEAMYFPVAAQRQIPTIKNEKGDLSEPVTDRMVQEAGRCRDEDEGNKATEFFS